MAEQVRDEVLVVFVIRNFVGVNVGEGGDVYSDPDWLG